MQVYDQMVADSGAQVLFFSRVAAVEMSANDTIDKDNRLAELRDILLGTQKPGFRELYPVRFPWLNSTQETAVNKVLCTRDVSIVHGPPGTGKTTTLVEAIYETLHREPQVLVCAQSNTAVDWICEKLVDRGVPVLRIGNPTRVNDKMLSSTYERRFESHPAIGASYGLSGPASFNFVEQYLFTYFNCFSIFYLCHSRYGKGK